MEQRQTSQSRGTEYLVTEPSTAESSRVGPGRSGRVGSGRGESSRVESSRVGLSQTPKKDGAPTEATMGGTPRAKRRKEEEEREAARPREKEGEVERARRGMGAQRIDRGKRLRPRLPWRPATNCRLPLLATGR